MSVKVQKVEPGDQVEIYHDPYTTENLEDVATAVKKLSTAEVLWEETYLTVEAWAVTFTGEERHYPRKIVTAAHRLTWTTTKKKCPECGGAIEMGVIPFASDPFPMSQIKEVRCSECSKDYSNISFSKI